MRRMTSRTAGSVTIEAHESAQLGPNRAYPMDNRHRLEIVADPTNAAPVMVGPRGFNRHFWRLRPGSRARLPGFPPNLFEVASGSWKDGQLTVIYRIIGGEHVLEKEETD